MFEDRIPGHLVVGVTHGPRITRTCGRQCRKPLLLKQSRASDIPWIRKQETAILMKCPKGRTFFCGRTCHVILSESKVMKRPAASDFLEWRSDCRLAGRSSD